MAGEIQVKTKESPRFDGNTLKWFYHNTFPYTLEIELIDSDTQEPITYNDGDKILVCFYDRRKNLVHTFEFNNLVPYEVGAQQFVEVTMNFDDDVTQKFDVGKYTYCTTYYGEYVTTIWDNADAEVEECH